MVLIWSVVKHSVGLMGFELCSFLLSQRIQKKFGQLHISTEDVCKQAQACHLFTLIDENLGVNISYPDMDTMSL